MNFNIYFLEKELSIKEPIYNRNNLINIKRRNQEDIK